MFCRGSFVWKFWRWITIGFRLEVSRWIGLYCRGKASVQANRMTSKANNHDRSLRRDERTKPLRVGTRSRPAERMVHPNSRTVAEPDRVSSPFTQAARAAAASEASVWVNNE